MPTSKVVQNRPKRSFHPRPVEVIVAVDILPPGAQKSTGTEVIVPLQPKEFADHAKQEGPYLYGLPLTRLVPAVKIGDRFRVTIERVPKTGEPPPSAMQILQQIFEELYVTETDAGQVVLAPEKEWSADTCERVAEIVSRLLPRPDRVIPYKKP